MVIDCLHCKPCCSHRGFFPASRTGDHTGEASRVLGYFLGVDWFYTF
jgi:hypothetical protein